VKRNKPILAVLLFLVVILALPARPEMADAAEAAPKKLIYDDAALLSQKEYDELNAMANQYGAERETDIMIVTTKNAENIDVMKLTQDFYDEHAPGYDKPHGNAVILTLDMNNREIYLAGFYKAELYLDDGRLDKIRDRITPDLSNGDYALAFQTYIQTAYKYMGVRPGTDPDFILFHIWFQLIVSIGVAGAIVSLMVFRSGGRTTVTRRTYEDTATSGIIGQRDQYIRTTITKQKIEKNNGGGSGGGGGVTRGGHSHSGSRGSF
jgi:uncharacterized protein